MSDREEMQRNRDLGLVKRHETREARAIRRAVAEEIAVAIVAIGRDETPGRLHATSLAEQNLADARFAGYKRAAEIAHEIGSNEEGS